MNVPLLDLKAQHRTIRDEVLAKVMEVVEAQLFILGQPVLDLEARMAELSRVKFGIGVASGTDALLLPLKALGLKPGDEVITVPFTFFATAGTIHNAGARPVFVDIEADTYNLDPAALEAAITPRTRAIMPVHLFGQMAAMERILAVALAHLVHDADDGRVRRVVRIRERGGRLAGAHVEHLLPRRRRHQVHGHERTARRRAGAVGGLEQE